MTAERTFRPARHAARAAAVAVLSLLVFAGAPLYAQRHGGGGGQGGPGGGPGGGAGGGIISGFAGNSVSPFNSNRRLNANANSPIRVEPQLGPPSRWWDDKKVIKYLNLRNDQQRRMDDIFEANRQYLTNLYGNLQREETRLVSLPPGDLQDESKVFAAIDRVSQARAELEKAHAHILLQIRQQMDAPQLATLDRDMASLR